MAIKLKMPFSLLVSHSGVGVEAAGWQIITLYYWVVNWQVSNCPSAVSTLLS